MEQALDGHPVVAPSHPLEWAPEGHGPKMENPIFLKESLLKNLALSILLAIFSLLPRKGLHFCYISKMHIFSPWQGHGKPLRGSSERGLG